MGDVATLAELNAQLIRDEGHRNRMGLAELSERMRGWLAKSYAAVLLEDGGAAVGFEDYAITMELEQAAGS